MRFVATAGLAVLLSSAAAQQTSQQPTPPVFRAGVDLVTVDVAVVDKGGQPVRRLAPADFTVIAGGRARRIVAANFVEMSPRQSRSGASTASIPAATSNSGLPAGRSLLFVVDVDHISSGTGRAALETISEYLDKLSVEDRVGIVALPYGTPRVDLTTNRRPVRDAALKIVGAKVRTHGATMTVGEAAAIERLDERAAADYIFRVTLGEECRLPIAEIAPDVAVRISSNAKTCLLRLLPAAQWIMDLERRKTRDLLDTLGALANAMASIDGPKSLVLVSEGLISDQHTIDQLRQFAAAAERGRVTFYALNLTGWIADAGSRYDMTTASALDRRELLDGTAQLTAVARGETFMISGTPHAALSRIDAELSGYYLLSFERDAKDRDGERQQIDVQVNQPGATVRTRREFTISLSAPVARPAIDLRAAVGETLRWPVPTTELGIDLDTYATPVLTGPETLKTVIVASFATAGQPLSAVGYEIADAEGKTVADGFESAALATESTAGDRRTYLAAVELPAGAYRIKLAGVTADGRRGSVEHEFEVSSGRLGALRLSDVILGETGGNGFRPTAWLMPGAATLPVALELTGDSASAYSGAVLTLELAPAGRAPLARVPLSMKPATDPRRQLAFATLAIGPLPTGLYTVTAVLEAADGTAIRRSRAFTRR